MNTSTSTYTKVMPCTPTNMNGYTCPTGWTSVGYTPIGSCTIGNVPGNGHEDLWRMPGWNRVCKKTVPTSGNIELDCCSNKEQIADSIECKSRGLTPYNNTCNIIMKNHCTSTNKNPYRHEWNGMPDGQDIPVYNPCTNTVYYNQVQESIAGQDEYCISYLKNAPPNNYFATHDFNDHPHDYPHYSYTTPKWNDEFGYYPVRKPYHSYNDRQSKNQNTYCALYPDQCYKEF